MEKVKIFTHGSGHDDRFEGLEYQVNEWLTINKNIEIVYRNVMGEGGKKAGLINCIVIVIFYKEK